MCATRARARSASNSRRALCVLVPMVVHGGVNIILCGCVYVYVNVGVYGFIFIVLYCLCFVTLHYTDWIETPMNLFVVLSYILDPSKRRYPIIFPLFIGASYLLGNIMTDIVS